jgi:hypothetical protein
MERLRLTVGWRGLGNRVLAVSGLAGLLACASVPEAPAPSTGPSLSKPEPVLALPEPEAGPPAHVLLVSVAGLVPGLYEADGPMPQLFAMVRAGAAADGVVPVAPAVPAVVHATLVTGRAPFTHGIGGDHPLGPQGVEPQHQRRADSIETTALWDVTREAGLLAGAIGWPSSVGAPVDWLFPELYPARLGESSPELLEGVATPALLASARARGAERPELGFPGPGRDALLVDLACEVLVGDAAPGLLLLRLSQTEPVLGRFGPDSAEALEAFAATDVELRRLAACLRDGGRLSPSAWFVVGDAPVQPVHTRIQANVALEASGLLVPGPGTRTGIRRWDAIVRANGSSALVYARDADAAVLARRALTEAAEFSRAFRIVSAQELLELASDREAWFGLEALPGYAFGDGVADGVLLRPSPALGAAGSFRRSDASPHRAGFVGWGAGVRSGVRIPEMAQVDVAPTVARLLGVPWPEGEGRALVGILRVRPVAGGRPDVR